MPSITTALKGNASIFAALGDATRLSLLGRLSDGAPQSISRLASGTSLTRQGITKHLHVLEDAGIVRSVRVGRESQFKLEPKSIAEAQRYLEHVSRQWDQALMRLKTMVEGETA